MSLKTQQKTEGMKYLEKPITFGKTDTKITGYIHDDKERNLSIVINLSSAKMRKHLFERGIQPSTQFKVVIVETN